MSDLQYSLLTDGTSDRALVPILDWLLREHVGVGVAVESADLSRVRPRPASLEERIRKSLELYPCDLLFVHRDAERTPLAGRRQEIEAAVTQASRHLGRDLPAALVVPVRMSEAWLLLEEQAIRIAAGNPNGREALAKPPLRDLEGLHDPKACLHHLLRSACGLRGRRLRGFRVHQAVHLVAQRIQDFSPLRQLPAFQALEQDVSAFVQANPWTRG